MTNVSFTISPVAGWREDSIAQGFVYECACGEHYREVRHAATCRKCRVYTNFGYCTHVVDIRTDEVVWGEVPSEEEQAAAALEWESMRAIERKEHELMCQMWAQEGELYEAEMARRAEAERLAAAELAEDQYWDIQDKLMEVA